MKEGRLSLYEVGAALGLIPLRLFLDRVHWPTNHATKYLS